MSYIRWGVEGSSVYIYHSVKGGWECCACRFAYDYDEEPTGEPSNFATRQELLVHINKHREHGDHVPRRVDERLLREIKESE